jgi:hypothetical protein
MLQQSNFVEQILAKISKLTFDGAAISATQRLLTLR